MTGQMADQSFLAPALSFVGGLVGGLFAGYFSKRGEIRAVHTELEKVVEQNSKITAATEEIKASISTKVWAREIFVWRRSSMRLRILQNLMFLITTVLSAHMVNEDGQFKLLEATRSEAQDKFQAGYDALAEVDMILGVACGIEVRQCFREYRETSIMLAKAALEGRFEDAIRHMNVTVEKADAVRQIVRRSLEMDL